MTNPPAYAPGQRDFRIGQIFSRALKLFTANFWMFLLVEAISLLPPRVAFLWANVNSAGSAADETTIRRTITFFAFVLWLAGQSVLVTIAVHSLRAQPARLGEAVQKAWARFAPILGLSFLICLAFVAMVVMFLLSDHIAFALILMLGSIVLVVMGSVALPACVVEGLGPLHSLRRSAELTKGHRWKIFAIIFLPWIVLPLVSAALKPVSSFLGPAVRDVGGFIFAVVLFAYFNSLLIMIYHDLRVAKEGIGPEQIIAVFD